MAREASFSCATGGAETVGPVGVTPHYLNRFQTAQNVFYKETGPCSPKIAIKVDPLSSTKNLFRDP